MKKINYIAHRGLHSKTIPENTIEAFSEAIKNHIDIEFDVRMTKDNELVIFHDASLKRMFNIDKNIVDLTYNELLKYKYINKECICKLSDVLNLVNEDVFLDIEIKNQKKPFKMAKLLSKQMASYKGNYSVKSFNPIISWYYKRLNKNIKCGVLSYKSKYKILSRCNYLFYKPDFISYNITDYNDTLDELFKKRNIEVHLWTIRNEKELKKAIKYSKTIIYENLETKKLSSKI